MPRLAPYLPQALVRFLPASADDLAEVAQEMPETDAGVPQMSAAKAIVAAAQAFSDRKRPDVIAA